MTAGPYGQAWEAYRQAGWNGVIPLPPRQKANPPKGTTGADGIWPSYADCMAWADGPEAAGNIALRLPHSVIGIDVDAYDGKPGAASFATAVERWGPIPPTWESSSRTDGVSRIKFYRVPEGLAWPGEIGPSTELIQYRHRYAVVWPSIHPDTGGTYQWYGPDGVPTGVPDVDQLPALPPAWVTGLTGGQAAAPTAARNNWSSAQVQAWLLTRPRALEEPCPRMRRALDDARLRLVAGASAHGTTISAVMRAVRLADEGHAGAINALTQLHTAFVANVTNPHRAGRTRTPGQAEKEWRTALDGAVMKVSAEPTGLDACDCDGRITNAIVAAAGPPLPGPSAHQSDPTRPNPQPDQTPPAQSAPDPFIEDQIRTETLKIQIRDEARRRARRAQVGAQAPPEPVLLTDFLTTPDEPQRYRIEGLWPVGGRVMLTAQFKSGKTTLVGNLIRALVDRQPFLERFLTHQPNGRVTVIDDELDEGMLRRWLRDQTITNTGDVAVIPLRGKVSTFDLLDPEIRAEWATRLAAVDTSVLVLDCLAPILDALGLSEDKEAGRFLVALDELAKTAGIEEIVLIHHMGHGSERARGASRLRDWPDVEWKLTREKGKDNEDDPAARRYFSAYGRDVDITESALDYIPEARKLILAGGSRKDIGANKARDDVVDYLTTVPDASGRQIELEFTGSDHTREAVRDALQAAIKDGEVLTRPGRGRAILHFLNPTYRTSGVRGGSSPVEAVRDTTPRTENTGHSVSARSSRTVRELVSHTPATSTDTNRQNRQTGSRADKTQDPLSPGGMSAPVRSYRESALHSLPANPAHQTTINIDGRTINTTTGEDLGPARDPL